MIYYGYVFYKILLKESIRWETMKQCQEIVEKQGDRLRKTFRQLQVNLGEDPKKGGALKEISHRKLTAYYEFCRYDFFGKLLPWIANVDKYELGTKEQEWKLIVQGYGMQIYDSLVKELNMSARRWIEHQKCRNLLFEKGGNK